MITFDYTLLDDISLCYLDNVMIVKNGNAMSTVKRFKAIHRDFMSVAKGCMSLNCSFCESPTGVIVEAIAEYDIICFRIDDGSKTIAEFSYPYIPDGADLLNPTWDEVGDYENVLVSDIDACNQYLLKCKTCNSCLVKDVPDNFVFKDDTIGNGTRCYVTPRAITHGDI